MASKQYQLKGLKEKQGQLIAELQKIRQGVEAQERAMTPEEKSKFDQIKQDFSANLQALQQVQADMTALDALIAQGVADTPAEEAPPAGEATPAPAMAGKGYQPGRGDLTHERQRYTQAARQRDIRLARSAWCRRQAGLPLSREHKEACKRTGINPNRQELAIQLGNPATRAQRWAERALTVTTSGGGYLIAEDYSYELEKKLVDFSNVRGICREIQTPDGSDLPWPTEDDTSNTGELLAINTEVAYADPTFGVVTFGAFKFSSKGVIVPNELIQDGAFDVDMLVMEEIGTRIGRIQATHFTTGNGSGQPNGVVTASTLGVTTANATAFTADELTRLCHSVDPAYRQGPTVGYMMKDDTLAYALTLKDAHGRPLLRESYAQGSGTNANRSGLTLNGFPVFVNQAMTGLTSNLPVSAAKHVLFGDFSKFIIRDAGGVRLRRLEERLGEKDQVLFVGFLRSDSDCVNTSAIKHLLQA